MPKKAQIDLDSVVKAGHLPDLEDEPSLPYITAIAKETLRWGDVLPFGTPASLSVKCSSADPQLFSFTFKLSHTSPVQKTSIKATGSRLGPWSLATHGETSYLLFFLLLA